MSELSNIPASLKRLRFTPLGKYTEVVIDPSVEITSNGHPDFSCDFDAPLVYADHVKDGGGVELIACQYGALRDDFDFGPVVWVRTDLLTHLLAKGLPEYDFAGWYDLRLRLSEFGHFRHIAEPIYEVTARQNETAAGEKQFDYVDPRNRNVQIEMERAVTDYLNRIGAAVKSDEVGPFEADGDFPVEASVIIPVLNRARTIRDAVSSALAQQTDFTYNIIVVDNRSSDGTSEILAEMSAADPRAVVIDTAAFPDRTFGIGGCWNLALQSEFCGRYAVQLDSDDVYSSADVLQRIVDKFRSENCGMVIGSYTLTDFDGNILPPGLIDHREWTDENGPNNALRINGLGAPRAFATAVARAIGFPNVSYGEDYAMGLAMSRDFRIGRIYESLYNCRRWEDNTDHSLTPAKINANNLYKDSVRTAELVARRNRAARSLRSLIDALVDSQLRSWPLAEANFARQAEAFESAAEMTLPDFPEMNVVKILAAHRRRSAIADVTIQAIRERGCFLCRESRPPEQTRIETAGYDVLVNPYPVTPRHLTIPSVEHTPQRLARRIKDMVFFAHVMWGQVVFYNGGKCGASAPDHFHFQVVTLPSKLMFKTATGLSFSNPAETCVPYVALGETDALTLIEKAEKLLESLPHAEDEEAMVNVALTFDGEQFSMKFFLRRAHRPRCFGEGEGRLSISPASVEMMGLFVTSSEEDFEALTPEKVEEIYRDVCVTEEQFLHIRKTIADL